MGEDMIQQIGIGGIFALLLIREVLHFLKAKEQRAEATLDVTEQFRKKGGGDAKVRAGDAIDDVFFHAGKPGEKGLQLLVDDVRLIGLD